MTADNDADNAIDADDRISAWLDGELHPVDRDAVDALRRERTEWAAAIDAVGAVRAQLRGLAMVEPPSGFLDSLLAGGGDEAEGTERTAAIGDLGAVRARRNRRATSIFVGAAAAAAILVAVVVPGVARTEPALATDIRVHQAGVASSGDPVSGLAPLGTPMTFGR